MKVVLSGFLPVAIADVAAVPDVAAVAFGRCCCCCSAAWQTI